MLIRDLVHFINPNRVVPRVYRDYAILPEPRVDSFELMPTIPRAQAACGNLESMNRVAEQYSGGDHSCYSDRQDG
ncbi:hypothetical protein Rrhod_2375 [Rhodococcus rhodnii LMG 5362]|uniref:Uncharacterized protein n=1 Tax=Rhodococcus rhodnii LMG 5362 TaxID=1273125 RepID=R7WLW2_9NOCA|nr:hypothetical protein Rrhod_2375 [Rhodococcus rhodnii LMG 5362]